MSGRRPASRLSSRFPPALGRTPQALRAPQPPGNRQGWAKQRATVGAQIWLAPVLRRRPIEPGRRGTRRQRQPPWWRRGPRPPSRATRPSAGYGGANVDQAPPDLLRSCRGLVTNINGLLHGSVAAKAAGRCASQIRQAPGAGPWTPPGGFSGCRTRPSPAPHGRPRGERPGCGMASRRRSSGPPRGRSARSRGHHRAHHRCRS